MRGSERGIMRAVYVVDSSGCLCGATFPALVLQPQSFRLLPLEIHGIAHAEKHASYLLILQGLGVSFTATFSTRKCFNYMAPPNKPSARH
jgi:hypothetical protein